MAGISAAPHLAANLERDGSECAFPDCDPESPSHYQRYAKLPTYYTPMLFGCSFAATLAYAMMAQGPAGTFLSALSLVLIFL